MKLPLHCFQYDVITLASHETNSILLLPDQTSSVEIERVCNGADEGLLETAAVSIKPSGGGPEQLAILAVLKDGSTTCDANLLKSKFQRAIQKNFNPLLKVRASLF